MRNKEKFDEILNECLEALEKGQSLEACLDRYPEHAQSLRPLLETALAARRVAKLRPRPEFKEAVRRRLREAAGHQVAVEQARRFHLRFGFAGAVALVLVLLVSGISTVAVAGNSMPDQPLYPVKLATEQTRLALAPSPIKKAAVHLQLADIRIEEIAYLAAKGESRYMDMVARRLGEHLDMVAILAAGTNGKTPPPAGVSSRPSASGAPAARGPENREQLRALLQQRALKNAEKLKEILNRAPPAVRPNLDRTIAQTSTGYQRALQNIERPMESGEQRPQPPARSPRTGT